MLVLTKQLDIDQGEKNGSFAIYLEPHHLILKIFRIKKSWR